MKRRPLTPHEQNRFFSAEHRDGELSDEDVIAEKRRLLEEFVAAVSGQQIVSLPLSTAQPGDNTMPKCLPRDWRALAEAIYEIECTRLGKRADCWSTHEEDCIQWWEDVLRRGYDEMTKL
jgi:hypothetical protein